MQANPLGTQKYVLAAYVRACCVHRHIVLLDLRSNTYLGVDGAVAMELGRYIGNWPTSAETSSGEDATTASEAAEILQEMLKTYLLEPSSARASMPTREAITKAEVPLIDDCEELAGPVSVRDVRRFLTAAFAASMLLKFCSLERIVSRVEMRRRRRGAPIVQFETIGSHDAERLRDIVRRFRRLRPLLFRENEECLFNALAMSEFLAQYGHYPTWVFGVTAEPFGAHCWLQQGTLLLSDAPDNVGAFSPILAV